MPAFRTIALSAAFLLALLMPVAAVSAASAEECSAQIDQLRGSVAAASFVNEKDRSTTDAKLGGAQEKLALAKPADAAEKLVDFVTRVERLGATGKLSSADAGVLVAGATDAIACVESISATT